MGPDLRFYLVAGEGFEPSTEIEDLSLEGYQPFRELSGTWEMDWELGLGTFLETYHIFSLHRASITPDFLSAPSLFEGSAGTTA